MKTILLLAALLVFVSGNRAFADYSFNFMSSDHTIGVSGTLITTPDGDGTFTATGGSVTGDGTANGGIVYSLVALNDPRVSIDPQSGLPSFITRGGTEWIGFDDLLKPGSNPVLTMGGLVFDSVTAQSDLNIYSTGISAYQVFVNPPGYSLLAGTTSVSPTPIPAAVYLFGSGLLGLVGIRKRML